MQTGMLNSENHSHILRGISQKRQNGVLEVLYGEYNVSIYFLNGKIVEVIDSRRDPIDHQRDILDKYGYLNKTDSGQLECSTYQELFVALNSQANQSKALDENTFRMALKKRILDALYDLKLDSPAVYNLKLQMVNYDRDFAPSISVGQILLDRVSLESDSERFLNTFPESGLIKRNDLAGISLTEEERMLFDAIERDTTCTKLSESVLLSRYALQHNLLSMYDRAIIDVEQRTILEASAARVLSDDILSVLEESSDRPFIEEELQPVIDDRRSQAKVLIKNTNKETDSADVTSDTLLDKVYQEESILVSMDGADIHQEQGHLKISRLAMINGQLLQSEVIPNVLIFIFMVLACTLPFYLWNEIMAGF